MVLASPTLRVLSLCTLLAALCLCACGGDTGSDCGTCDTNATCSTSVSPHACVCNSGYRGSGQTCAPVTCPALTVDHGSVTPAGEATYKAVATYSCSAGYKLSGVAARTCQGDGTWSGVAPTCAAVTNGCDAKPCLHGPCAPGDGAGYTCGPCEAGWSGANCDKQVTCDGLTDPPNGSVTPKSTTAGNTATYGCQAGYTLAGEATRTCQTDGTWSGSEPGCSPNRCSPDLSAPANGTVSATTGVTGDVVTYGCSQGYALAGNATRLCQPSGAWSGTAPTCAQSQTGCDSSPCAHGTCTPSGASGFTCACSTGWTGTRCDTAVTCSGATAPAHGSVSAASAAYGASVTYTCNAGYALSGPGTRQCQADGSFAGTAPTCAANACKPDLTAPNNGKVSTTTGVTGDVATYSCDPGYTLAGSSTRQCQPDATWSGAAPTCAQNQTGCSPNPCAHGNCTPSGTTGFTCACTAGWTGTICDQPVTCSGAVAPTHGSVSAASATLGTSVTYACDAGYTLSGPGVRTCQADGTFDGAAPTCTPNACKPDLAAPANGSVTITSGVTGDVATYGCAQGYSLNGSSTRQCRTDGTWSGSAPTCVLVTTGCTPNPCVHSASCTPVGASGYSCGTCDPGWSGANCDVPITCAGATAPSHGQVSAASATFGQSVTYSCDNGYSLNGPATRACQADGSFGGTAPTCAPVDCGAPPVVANAAAPVVSGGAGGGNTFGATAAYSCSTGYAKGGTDPTCGATGSWSAAPACNVIDCGAPPTVAHAGAPAVSGGLAGGNTYGATAAYSCATGYAKGGTDSTCSGAGWSAPPTCSLIDCGVPPAVANASVPAVSGGLGGGTSDTYGASAAYSCNNGFNKSGSDPTCGSTGWTAAPTCAPFDCGTPPVVANAGVPVVSGGAGGGNTFGATAAYSCDAHYNKSGSDALCGATGWSAAPACNAISCGTPPTVTNAGAPTVSGGLGGGSTPTWGATAAYACNAGFTNKAGTDPTCGGSGSWSAAPTCNAVDCGTPPTVANAGTPTVSGGAGGGSTDTYGATAVYTCNSNFTKHGTDPVCAATSQWGAPPTCVATSCGTYTDVVYHLTGQFRIGDTTLGMGNQTFTGLGANATTPPFEGAGDTTPFTGNGTFKSGFARLRFTNDASGNPQAGAVSLVEWYFPLEFKQTAGATIPIDTDHSVGLLASGVANCGGGDAACNNHAPTISRPCAANAQGTLSGTTLAWGSCAPATSGKTSWNYVSARAVSGAGCAVSWNAWGHAGPCSGAFCGSVPGCSLKDAYQTWNQQLASLTFSGVNPTTATFTMPEIQVPNCSGASTTWLRITASTVVQTQCGSTPGTDLVCDVQ